MKTIHWTLAKIKITRKVGEEFVFNLWNPVGYIVLLVVAIGAGLIDAVTNFCKTSYTIIRDVLKSGQA